VGCGLLFRFSGKELFDLVGYEEGFIGQSETLAGGFGELGTTFTVSLGRALDFGDSLPDEGFAGDEFRMAVAGCFGFFEYIGKGLNVLGVHLEGFETVGFKTLPRVLALGLRRHRVEGDTVVVVEEDQIVETEVAGEGRSFGGDSFLQAAVTGEANDTLVENFVVGGVVAGGCHLCGNGKTDSVPNPLAERAGRALDPRSFSVFGMPRCLATHLPESTDLVDGQIEPAQVKP